jgi:hypothetical protein
MSSSIRRELEGFVAGRVKAERLVIAVAAAYYRDSRNGNRESLRPLIDVIDRASPGIVELGIVAGGAGFEIRLADRPFPKEYESELKRAAEAVLSGYGIRDAGCVNSAETPHPVSRISHPVSPISHLASRISHLVSWIRRLFFRASA